MRNGGREGEGGKKREMVRERVSQTEKKNMHNDR